MYTLINILMFLICAIYWYPSSTSYIILTLPPGLHAIFNCGRPSLAHQYYIYSVWQIYVQEYTFKEIMQFHYYMNLYGHTLAQETLLRAKILPWSSLLIFLSMIWNREDFKRNNAFSLYMLHVLIWPCCSTRTPAPEVMKLIILVEPSFVIITLYLVCFIYAWE